MPDQANSGADSSEVLITGATCRDYLAVRKSWQFMDPERFYARLSLGEGESDVLSYVEAMQSMMDRHTESQGQPVDETPDWMIEAQRRRIAILGEKKYKKLQLDLATLEQCFQNCAEKGFLFQTH